MSIARVGVVGCGIMGSGIAEVCARAGLEVTIFEPSQERLVDGRTRITKSLSAALAKNKISQDLHDNSLNKFLFTTDLNQLSDRDLVIEAVVEDFAVKRDLFAKLDFVCAQDTILATNTSSLSITKVATSCLIPERVVGIHFFNPATVLNLVEIISGIQTNAQVAIRATDFALSIGKTPIQAKDQSGFIVNALLIPFLLSAIRMFDNGLGSAEDIDLGMTLGAAHPIGPLHLCDLIGLDTCKSVAEAMYAEHADPIYACPPLLARMVDAGLLGRKSGRGFFEYSN